MPEGAADQFAAHPVSRPSMRPVRPIRPARQLASVPFSAFGTIPFRSYGFVPRRSFSDQNDKKTGFFDFLKVLKKTDADAAAAQDGSEAQEEGIDKVVAQQGAEENGEQQSEASQSDADQLSEAGESAEGTIPTEVDAAVPNLTMNEQLPTIKASVAEQEELRKLYARAVAKYDTEFFKQFSFSGKDSLKMAQRGLEEYILSIEDTKDVELLLLSMIKQSYELNEYIPNVELLLYKMFFSPITTRAERANGADRENLLFGNLFADRKMQLHGDIYGSLLMTLSLNPKKKHYKKMIEYIRVHEPVNEVSQILLDHIVQIGVDHQYPITLGQTVRDLIVKGDYKIHRSTFMNFVMFLERSKGFEEDAKKFLFLTR